MLRRTSDSIDIKNRQFNLSSNMLERSSFLISFSFENDRSPVQFETIIERNILKEVSIFGKVAGTQKKFFFLYTFFINLC